MYISSTTTTKKTDNTGNLSELLKGVCAELLLQYTEESFQLKVQVLHCTDMLPQSCYSVEQLGTIWTGSVSFISVTQCQAVSLLNETKWIVCIRKFYSVAKTFCCFSKKN